MGHRLYEARWAIALTALFLVLASSFGVWRYQSLPASDRYFLPVTAEDWAAWGTWAGALGAVGAVYFAAKSIRHSIEAQRGTERELKADRLHDREEREKERKLVREEREALKQEADQLALQEAKQLSFRYSWGVPSDSEYEEVQRRWDQPPPDQDHFEDWQRADEEDDDIALRSAFVIITNRSREIAFKNLSLKLLENDLDVTGVAVAHRKAPPRGELIEGSPPEWKWEPDHVLAFPAQMKQWALGTIKPREQLLVKLSFDSAQSFVAWDSTYLWNWSEWHSPSDARWVLLEYHDAAGRLWMRSTRSPANVPIRPLVDKRS